MKTVSKKVKILILALVLAIISAIYIIIHGSSYVITINDIADTTDINDINVEIEDEGIVVCTDKYFEDGILKVKIESKSEGKTFVDIKSTDGSNYSLNSAWVHKFGTITLNEYMGDCTGSVVIPISVTILLVYILYLLIVSYRQSMKINMYQYKNIVYLSVIVFMAFAVISQIKAIFNYRGLINIINEILGMFSMAVLLLPIAFVVSILVILSNVSLIKKEGFSLRNILGILLGAFLCISTILPEIMYNTLYNATWIDIHNQNGIGVYLYDLVEKTIYIVITYIECVLIGTIILGIKAARHKPKFDKDAIVILGCQIKKDGTLTNLLKARVDKAIEFSKMQKEEINKDIIFVPSGGKGDDEVISEAQAMKNYLIGQGIKEENILIEDKSKNTYENIKFSNIVINEKIKDAKVVFSTTNYHVFRAGNIAEEQNLNFEGIGAGTKPYFWINAFIREFIATLYSEKKKHIAMITSIILVTIIMIAINYFNNNI